MWHSVIPTYFLGTTQPNIFLNTSATPILFDGLTNQMIYFTLNATISYARYWLRLMDYQTVCRKNEWLNWRQKHCWCRYRIYGQLIYFFYAVASTGCKRQTIRLKNPCYTCTMNESCLCLFLKFKRCGLGCFKFLRRGNMLRFLALTKQIYFSGNVEISTSPVDEAL